MKTFNGKRSQMRDMTVILKYSNVKSIYGLVYVSVAKYHSVSNRLPIYVWFQKDNGFIADNEQSCSAVTLQNLTTTFQIY